MNLLSEYISFSSMVFVLLGSCHTDLPCQVGLALVITLDSQIPPSSYFLILDVVHLAKIIFLQTILLIFVLFI